MEKCQSITDFLKDKNSGLSGEKFYDFRIDKFKKELNKYNLFNDGQYRIIDLDKAWHATSSKNVYDDHGIQSI